MRMADHVPVADAEYERGVTVSATTMRAWLRAAGLGPARKRGEMTWREFIQGDRQSLLAVDFHGQDDLAAAFTSSSSSSWKAAICRAD
jgi:hypothetical protein